MIEGLKYQTCHQEPGKLDQDSQKNKPDISLLKGLGDAFQFTKTEIDKSGAKEEDQDEDEFPHIWRDYTQTPAKRVRGCL